MKKIIFNDNYMETNCYLLEFDGSALVIDPTKSFDLLPKGVKQKIKGVFITHGHFDHFEALESYKNKNITFYMHKKCFEKVSNSLKNCSYMGYKKLEVNLKEEKVVFLKENDIINDFEKEIKVIELFGHTDCSLGFIIDYDIFCGDAIFLGSIGRTDLYSGNFNEMKKTTKKVKQIKENYTIYPGHGDITTLDNEKKNNYYFK